jgi:hypothetical protein
MEATVLRGDEGRSSVASSNTKEQRGILQQHGAPSNPPKPRNSVTFFNTKEQRGILQHHSTLIHGVE